MRKNVDWSATKPCQLCRLLAGGDQQLPTQQTSFSLSFRLLWACAPDHHQVTRIGKKLSHFSKILMIYIIHVLFSGGGVHRRWGEAHPAGRCCPLSPPSMLHPGIPHLLPATLPRPSLPFLLYTRDTYLLYTCTSPTLSVQPRLSTPLKSLRCVDWVWGLIIASMMMILMVSVSEYFEIFRNI